MPNARFHHDVARGSTSQGSAQAVNAALLSVRNRGLSDAGVGIGTTASKVRTGATFNYTINGQFYTKGATDDFWTLAGPAIPPSSFGSYILAIDAAGAASVYASNVSTFAAEADFSSISKVSPWAPIIEVLNAGKTIVGMLTVATNASTTFTPGTTLLSAAGVTDTYLDGINGDLLLPLIAGPDDGLYGAKY